MEHSVKIKVYITTLHEFIVEVIFSGLVAVIANN